MVMQETVSILPEGDIRSRHFLLSADCHVVEPPDLWEKRVDADYRHRLPRQEVDEHGVKWQVIEGHRPTRIADIKLEGEDLERSRAGSRDPEERLRDHARDGPQERHPRVGAEVLRQVEGAPVGECPFAVRRAEGDDAEDEHGTA